MKLIKVKGIVLKEVNFADNDKIITLLTDKIGLITCMAKGSRRSKSHILASSQFLVYSEFILYKGSKFYHVNSASTINTFYKLRMDFDMLTDIFDFSKMIISLTDENIDTENILKLVLNTLHLIENKSKDKTFLNSIFIIKFLSLLGFGINYTKCSSCNEIIKNEVVYYDPYNNIFLCNNCKKKSYIKLEYSIFCTIKYILSNDINKVLSFSIDENNISILHLFSKAFYNYIVNNM